MTVAGIAAAARVTSAASRLEALRDRARQLHEGVPVSVDHLLQARAWAEAQRNQTENARRRLMATHLAAADRHNKSAVLLDAAGKPDRAERLRQVARQHEEAALELSDGIIRGLAKPTEQPISSPTSQLEANRRLVALVSSMARSRSGAALGERVGALWYDLVRECGSASWRGWSQAVCELGTRRLPTVAGIAITAFDGSIHQPLAASDSWTESVEEIQQLIGDGPSMTASQERRPVVVDDLGLEHRRWPGYVSACAQTGLNSLWALPLELDECVVGVVTFYRTRLGPVPAAEWPEADTVAQAALTASIGDLDELANASMRTQAAWSAMVVHIATGIIASTLGVTPADALTRLRAHAFASNQRLKSVAQRVVAGTLTCW